LSAITVESQQTISSACGISNWIF